ncbi:MAG: hypothetical protein J6W29_02645 [Neisseriaceae bacterium]|nr:hypothetical protein [Neisseriaceae bacterium]
MARKYRSRDDYNDYDDDNYEDSRKKGWYGKFLLISLLIIASVVGFLVYRTYEMLTTGEKAVYTSPISQQNQIQTDESNVAVLSPTGKDAVTPNADEFNVENTVEQLNPEQEVYEPTSENAETTKAPIDPTNRSFDQEVDNLF